eukprot:gene15395-biopygen8787
MRESYGIYVILWAFGGSGVLRSTRIAECRGWPRREDEDDGDVEQGEVVEVDEDCEGRFESVSDFKDTT